jgi:hypothetical protein
MRVEINDRWGKEDKIPMKGHFIKKGELTKFYLD